MPDAFYLPDGDRLVPTDFTRGPWDPGAQHAGPPAALMGRAVEALDPDPALMTARMTVEVLRPVPLRPLRAAARIVHGGRRVRLVEAELTADGDTVAAARAWRIRMNDGSVPEVDLEPPPLPGPAESPPWEGTRFWNGESYFTAMRWRLAAGELGVPGPHAAWMRMTVALVAGEEVSPLTRVLAAADSGNGISGVLPIERFLFINTELSVHLARPAEGEWVCLDARTRIGSPGVGLAQSALWDERGRIGAGAQSLLVAPR